jgi:hypothetical protein
MSLFRAGLKRRGDMNRILWVLVFTVGGVGVPRAAEAREQKPVAEKQVQHTVVLITAVDGGMSYEALESTKVAARRTELMTEYRNAAREWMKKRTGPRPGTPSVAVVKSVRGSEEAAKLIEQLEAKHSIIQVRGIDGKPKYEAVPSIGLAKRKVDLDAEYQKAQQEYVAAKKKLGPRKAYKLKAPRKPSMTVIKRDLKDRETAEAAVAKLQGGSR